MDAKEIAEAMDNEMCKSCASYKYGCEPWRIIECTKYFLNTLESIADGLRGKK